MHGFPTSESLPQPYGHLARTLNERQDAPGMFLGQTRQTRSATRLGSRVRLYARRFRRAVGLGGQRCQVTSLVVAVAVQPRWWAIVWWRPQSSAPLSRLVWPPSAQ